jgi:hypothetical protein
MYEPIGFYVDCDAAECAYCHEPESWKGFESWTEPLAIFADSEADTPTHCAVCEELIPHALTPDGYAYVRESLIEAQRDSRGRQCIVRQWVEEYLDEESEAVADWPERDAYSPVGAS